jgi:hypothetical protein
LSTTFPDALSVLSAMITPAVLISGCASLIMATTGRLNRAVDRTRETAAQLAAFVADAATQSDAGRDEALHRLMFQQLDYSTTRSRLLQRGLTRLYFALGAFVATSVAIGIVAVTGSQYALVPIAFGLAGAALLLYACVVLVRESQIALTALDREMDFVWERGRTHATPEMLAQWRAMGLFGAWFTPTRTSSED